MAEETILTWNAANWITILLMVILGFAVLGMIAKVIQQKRRKTAAA